MRTHKSRISGGPNHRCRQFGLPGLFSPQQLETACVTLQWRPKNLLRSSFPGPRKGSFPSCISWASLQCKRRGFWSNTSVVRHRKCGQRQYSEAIRLIFHRNQRRFLVQWTKHKTNHQAFHHRQNQPRVCSAWKISSPSVPVP